MQTIGLLQTTNNMDIKATYIRDIQETLFLRQKTLPTFPLADCRYWHKTNIYKVSLQRVKISINQQLFSHTPQLTIYIASVIMGTSALNNLCKPHTHPLNAQKIFWEILTSGLDGLETFGLVAFVTLLKLGVLSGRAEKFLHTKFHQNPLRNDRVTAVFTFLLRHFIQ